MRTHGFALISALSSLGCPVGAEVPVDAGDPSSADEADPAGEAGSPDSPGLDPRGDDPDDTHDPGEGPGAGRERYCDVASLGRLPPTWIVAEPSPIAGSLPLVTDLVVAEDSLFVANWHTASGGPPLGSIERRTLAGELLWAVELDKPPWSIAWDGERLYAGFGRELRRWDRDGVADSWTHATTNGWDVFRVAVDANAVALLGTLDGQLGPHEDFTHSFYGAVTKTMPAEFHGYGHLDAEDDDVGTVLAASPWGGWVAGGTYRGNDPRAWLTHFSREGAMDGGPDPGVHGFTTTFHRYDHPHLEALIAHDDLLYVGGWSHGSPVGAFWLALDANGEEVLAEDLELCPGAHASLYELVEQQGRLFGLGAAKIGPEPDDTVELLVSMDYDGTVVEVTVLDAEPGTVVLEAIASDGERVFVGGSRARERVIAEVEP